MITRVVLAKLSPTMEEGTIVKWSKKEGDSVKVGDVLAEIETDKANMEMEALGAGILRKILVPQGGKAPVGALIGVVADAAEDIESLVAQAAASPATAPAPAPESAPAGAPPAATASAIAEVAAREPARPPLVTVPAGARVKASPLARSMAAQRNLAIDTLRGSGPGGRVVKRDIEAYLAAVPGRPSSTRSGPAMAPVAPAPRPAVPGLLPGQSLPLTGMRKTIARRLSESAFTAPHFYVTVEIDMDAAVSVREQLVRAQEVKIAYDALIVRACALAMRRFPMVNASWTDEAIVTHAATDVGVAVSLPEGLITPVIRAADSKSVVEISDEIRSLAARAREKKLKPEEYTGATFTISNLGMYDVSEFTAIINPPGSAILAVGAIKRVPVVDGDAVRIGSRMKATLSSDHRVIDGALAADFLREVRRLLENPISLFV